MFADMSNLSRTIAKVGSAVVLIMSITSACGGSNEDDEDYSRPSYPDTPLPAETIGETTDLTETPIILSKPQPPDHNYDERRGETYFYIGAVSEEDQKRGRATGNVVAFQYLGTNNSGEHILAYLRTNGTVSHRLKCSKPCRIIDSEPGEKIAYSSTSIIGSALDDAFRGKLRIAEWAKNETARARPAAKATQPPEFIEWPLEAPPLETPSNGDSKKPPSDAPSTESSGVTAVPVTPVTD